MADLHAPTPSTNIGPASSHVSVGTSTATIPVDVASLINHPHSGWDLQQLAMYFWVCILPNLITHMSVKEKRGGGPRE